MSFLNKVEVGPIGPTDAKIAFVGEAPGKKEIIKGEPFVGDSGGVFDKCLTYAGIIRSEVYITNLFKFQVVKDSAKNIYNGKTLLYHTKRGFTEDAQEYLEEFYNELDSLKCNIIVGMGAPAALALANKNSITKWRGSIIQSSYRSIYEHKERKVLLTVHPAHTIWGAPLDKYKIAADFKKAADNSHTPDPLNLKQHFIAMPDFTTSLNELYKYQRYAAEGRCINFDIEILNGQIDCISFAVDRYEAVSISLSNWPHEQEREIVYETAKIFETPNAHFCNQNILFDITTLGFKNSIINDLKTQQLDDPMAAMNIMYPDFPKSLAFLCSIKTNIPYYKDDGKIFTGRGITKLGGSDAHRRYNCQDSCASLWCMEELRIELEQLGYTKQYNDTIRLYPVLATMMLHGVRVDRNKLEAVKKDLEVRNQEAQNELDGIVGRHLNVASSKACQEYFYNELRITPYRKNGSITTDETAMMRLVKGTASRKPLKEAALVLEIRRIRKLLSTYFSVQTDDDGRLRSSYNPRGTTTGRLSSSQTIYGTGLNMQNIPEEFRAFIVPDPGYFFVEIDKRQAEWVVVAYVSGDARMIEVHEKGLDAHIRTAQLITGLDEDLIRYEDSLLKHETDATTLYKARKEKIPDVLKYAKFLPRTMTCRQMAKKANHGLNYGMGYRKFGLINMIPDDEAKIIVNKYHEAYLGIRNNFFAYVNRRLQTDRTLENLFEHKRRFLEPYGQQLLNKGYDYIPQSTVGWIINFGLIDIYHSKSLQLKEAEIMTQTHDSALIQLPLTLTPKEIYEAVNICCNHFNPKLEFQGRTFIIGTDLKVGYDWKNMKECSWEDSCPEFFKNTLNI